MSNDGQAERAMTSPPAARRRPSVSIVMPVRNERMNLRIMLKILQAVVDVEHEVVIVYDDLEDQSIPIIEEIGREYTNIRGVQNTLGRGAWYAIKAGIEAAKCDVVLIF